jgi:raffinose/stachyose/melibiose transport system permease protein
MDGFQKTKTIVSRFLVNLLVSLLSLSCIFPVVWMMYSSLKTQKEFALNIVSLPSHPQFANYSQALVEGNLGVAFLNSMLYTTVSVVFAVTLAFIIGYLLSRFSFPGRSFVYTFFLAGMLIPVYALLIPIFLEFKMFGLLNKRITLIIPYIAFALPVGVFLVESYVKSIPMEMEEAACIDGCSFTQTLVLVIFPICKPVLSTTAILSFLSTWNEFPLALVLIRSNRLKTLPLGVTNFVGTYTVNYPLMFAALVISALPVILMYLVFSQNVMHGMVNGAVKG